jgi:hypothetical protein
MQLVLTREDLDPAFSRYPSPMLKVGHFKPEVQRVIMLMGTATFKDDITVRFTWGVEPLKLYRVTLKALNGKGPSLYFKVPVDLITRHSFKPGDTLMLVDLFSQLHYPSNQLRLNHDPWYSQPSSYSWTLPIRYVKDSGLKAGDVLTLECRDRTLYLGKENNLIGGPTKYIPLSHIIQDQPL